ncbi:MAG TPA: DinB family protein [Candidatus Dormibacteraeota bacterium]|nr:DinB family protein [Candidatus Dormibacteraeota bacterium]
MSRQEEAAASLEAASAELAAFIASCPDEVWHKTVDGDGRTVAALAAHCAIGNDVALAWILQLMAGRPVLETPEMHDARNATEGERFARAPKAGIADALRRSTERTARFLRSLADDELDRMEMLGVAGREVTVGRFVANFGRHMAVHLESMKTAL